MATSTKTAGTAHVRRADENAGAAAFGANPETHKLESYPLLDWLRFVLASVVALSHEGVKFPSPITAGLAVDVFLALSGWLIGGILIATPVSGLPRFFFNRATRIWIPYAAALTLVYGLAVLKEGIDLNWLKYFFYDVTFTHYNFTIFPRATMEMPLGGTGNHFWSLSIEEQFYLLSPIVMLTLPFGKKPWVWLLLGAAMLALGMRAAPIALGVAAAAAQKNYGDWHTSRIGRPLILAGTALVFAAMCFRNVLPLHGLFAAGAVLSLALVGRRSRIGLFFGAVSYPLYLNHWVGAFFSHGLHRFGAGLPKPIAITIAYLCAVAFGILMWALVDRWVMAHRSGWFTRERGRALGACAYVLVTVGLIGGLVIRFYGG